jgi:predicted aspartyl protease
MTLPTSTEAQERFEQEQRAYWQQRDELLQKYAGKWVALVGGQVVASGDQMNGDQMNKVAAEALRKTGSSLMYVDLVGGEDVVVRVRRAAQGRYDFAYTPSMPTLTASLRNVRGDEGTEVTFVVDTGADLTLLQNATADQAGLWNLAGQVRVAAIGGQPEGRLVYNALVRIAGQSVLATADCREDIGEDILGRDVINEFSVTLCQKRDQVEFEQA